MNIHSLLYVKEDGYSWEQVRKTQQEKKKEVNFMNVLCQFIYFNPFPFDV